MAKQKPKPTSGGGRLMAAGKRPMTLGLSPEQSELIEKAAEQEGRPMTNFVLYHALEHARAILKARK